MVEVRADVVEALFEEVRSLRKLMEEKGVERLTVSFTEAAQILGRHVKTLSRMEKRGEIQTVPIGGDRMIPMAELRRLATPSRALPARQRIRRAKGLTGRAAKAEIEAMLKRKR